MDDGARLWVNGQLIIDRWNPTPNTYFDVPGTPIALTANQLVDLKLEYQIYSDAYVVLNGRRPRVRATSSAPPILSAAKRPRYDAARGFADGSVRHSCRHLT